MERSADWLNQAQGDLAHARNDLTDGFYDWSCFSAQQAAEKVVKAVLFRASGEAWGYSVADLLSAMRTNAAVPDDTVEAGLELDKAYIAARYPDDHPSGAPRNRYTRTEAQRIVYADPARDDAYKLVWHLMQTRGLEPHVYSESEAAVLQTTLDRMTRTGIDLLTDD